MRKASARPGGKKSVMSDADKANRLRGVSKHFLSEMKISNNEEYNVTPFAYEIRKVPAVRSGNKEVPVLRYELNYTDVFGLEKEYLDSLRDTEKGSILEGDGDKARLYRVCVSRRQQLGDVITMHARFVGGSFSDCVPRLNKSADMLSDAMIALMWYLFDEHDKPSSLSVTLALLSEYQTMTSDYDKMFVLNLKKINDFFSPRHVRTAEKSTEERVEEPTEGKKVTEDSTEDEQIVEEATKNKKKETKGTKEDKEQTKKDVDLVNKSRHVFALILAFVAQVGGLDSKNEPKVLPSVSHVMQLIKDQFTDKEYLGDDKGRNNPIEKRFNKVFMMNKHSDSVLPYEQAKLNLDKDKFTVGHVSLMQIHEYMVKVFHFEQPGSRLPNIYLSRFYKMVRTMGTLMGYHFCEFCCKNKQASKPCDGSMLCRGCEKEVYCASGKTMLFCGGCFEVLYCDKECQTRHWAEHKTICPKMTKAQTEQTIEQLQCYHLSLRLTQDEIRAVINEQERLSRLGAEGEEEKTPDFVQEPEKGHEEVIKAVLRPLGLDHEAITKQVSELRRLQLRFEENLEFRKKSTKDFLEHVKRPFTSISASDKELIRRPSNLQATVETFDVRDPRFPVGNRDMRVYDIGTCVLISQEVGKIDQPGQKQKQLRMVFENVLQVIDEKFWLALNASLLASGNHDVIDTFLSRTGKLLNPQKDFIVYFFSMCAERESQLNKFFLFFGRPLTSGVEEFIKEVNKNASFFSDALIATAVWIHRTLTIAKVPEEKANHVFFIIHRWLEYCARERNRHPGGYYALFRLEKAETFFAEKITKLARTFTVDPSLQDKMFQSVQYWMLCALADDEIGQQKGNTILPSLSHLCALLKNILKSEKYLKTPKGDDRKTNLTRSKRLASLFDIPESKVTLPNVDIFELYDSCIDSYFEGVEPSLQIWLSTFYDMIRASGVLLGEKFCVRCLRRRSYNGSECQRVIKCLECGTSNGCHEMIQCETCYKSGFCSDTCKTRHDKTCGPGTTGNTSFMHGNAMLNYENVIEAIQVMSEIHDDRPTIRERVKQFNESLLEKLDSL
jgi:hypothetical protein